MTMMIAAAAVGTGGNEPPIIGTNVESTTVTRRGVTSRRVAGKHSLVLILC
jgi:hypothetical protein